MTRINYEYYRNQGWRPQGPGALFDYNNTPLRIANICNFDKHVDCHTTMASGVDSKHQTKSLRCPGRIKKVGTFLRSYLFLFRFADEDFDTLSTPHRREDVDRLLHTS